VPRIIEFPPFRLDTVEQRLWRGATPLDLRPRTYAVLLQLVQRPERLLRHDELLEAVWGDSAVTPGTLNTSIRELRRTLGDDARKPRYIETVHRRGFRFVAQVRSSDEPAASRGTPSAPTPLLGPTSLHGRQAELHELERRLAKAEAGTRQIVFVLGELGSGKTSLVQAFVERHAAEEGEGSLRIARGECVRQHDSREAYHPVLDALDRLTRSEASQVMRETLRRSAPTWLLQLPWLLEPGEAGVLRRELGAATAARMLREFCVTLEMLTRERTLVLVLEDLHWSDSATVDLIEALARRADPARLLLVGTYRPVDAAMSEHPIAPLRRSLRRSDAVADLALAPLPESAVRSYLRERFDWSQEPPGLAALIQDQTDGNPLFMVTLTSHLVSRELLCRRDEEWKLAVSPESLADQVPESLGDIVDDQLERLTAEEREVLEVASVTGESFAVQTLAAGMESDAERLEQTCGRLARWGQFIETQGVARWPDGTSGTRFRFRHAAFRRIIDDRIAPLRRQQLHLRIGERIEAAHAADLDRQAHELALHFEQGGDRERAIDYLERAANQLRRRFADREAMAYLRHALELLEALPDSNERARRELELRIRLARAATHALGYSARDMDENLERASGLARRLDDAERLAVILTYQSRSLSDGGRADALRALARQHLELELRLEDPVLMAQMHNEMATGRMLGGALDSAEAEYAVVRRYLEGLDAGESNAQLGHDLGTLSGGLSALTAWLRGQPETAQRRAAESLERAERIGEAFALYTALVLFQMLAHLMRDAAAVRELGAQLAKCLEENGFSSPYAFFHAAEGWLLVQDGELAGGIARLESGLAEARATGACVGLPLLLGTLAEAELARGATPSGLAALDEAVAFAEETGERFWEAEIHRLRGELLLLGGERDPAEASFCRALEVAGEQGARALELRAATSLARFWKERGDMVRARALLAPVHRSFEQGHDTRDFREAQLLLEAL